MVLRFQIAKFKFGQYLLRVNLPNLMLAKLSHYTVVFYKITCIHVSIISGNEIWTESHRFSHGDLLHLSGIGSNMLDQFFTMPTGLQSSK